MAEAHVPQPLAYDANCRRCPRLATHLDQVAVRHPSYHARPVRAFGAEEPRLLVVGLAPGLHGANRSGRPFTGDHAGILLYATLHRFGFASASASHGADDGLRLIEARITNAVQCLPPQNKPLPEELRQCNGFLRNELALVPPGGAIVALGGLAHAGVLRALGLPLSACAFAHGAQLPLAEGRRLFASYHCSRYNTNTRRLTPAMFEAVFAQVREHLAPTP